MLLGESRDVKKSIRHIRCNSNIPKGWRQPVYHFKQNLVTQEGFDLGKKLFYDGRLSKDGNFPCASCHQQFAAFATYDHNLSHGFNNSFTKRNAPPLFNLAWQKEFMWDGGINHLDMQPLAPMTDSNEMGEYLDSIILKLKADMLTGECSKLHSVMIILQHNEQQEL